jgi:hypothetical protein
MKKANKGNSRINEGIAGIKESVWQKSMPNRKAIAPKRIFF